MTRDSHAGRMARGESRHGRRTAVLDHRAVGPVLTAAGLTPWKLERATPRCWDYWRRRLEGRTALTIEDLGLISEVTGKKLGELAEEVWAAVDADNPARVKGTLIEVR